MKRNAAIVGRTPEFVRWSIRHACQFREETSVESPEQTERLLRSIHEVGLAQADGRVCDDLALKSFSDASETKWCGVFIDEVFAPFGGESVVRQQCSNCRANVQQQMAGCYGMLIANDFEIVDQRQWYLIWNPDNWADHSAARRSLDVLESITRSTTPADSIEQFVSWSRAAIANQLLVDVQFYPSGYSDGLHWTIDAHCPECKASQQTDQDHCDVCGRRGAAVRAQKRKVLGRRPFLSLESLIGIRAAEKIYSWCQENLETNDD